MIAKFNPTGTHVNKGFLKIRIDLYPDITSKTHTMHYVQVPVIPSGGYQGEVDKDGFLLDQEDYNQWIESLPKVWQFNPCLCHFITIDADTSLTSLVDYVKSILDKSALEELDDLLSKERVDNVRLSQIMNSKRGKRKVLTKEVDVDKLNSRLKDLEVIV